MPDPRAPDGELTALLRAANDGDEHAHTRMLGLVYGELRRMAGRYLRGERDGHTLQPTALVHEVYLRLFSDASVQPRDRTHLFALAAQQMRRILVDYARSRHAAKRGGRQVKITLSGVRVATESDEEDILAVHEALERLASQDPRAAQVVELRFFGGLQEEEIAQIAGVSVGTVKRDWRFARSWLLLQLDGKAVGGQGGPAARA